ncbi:hypothetical protein Rvan_1504 [Rhodomicrobium vannielii ATCC 17100]|jgi:hypothetical protein|uniref:Uncharacterized protein n=1 Tax=Rhodomicrobium vannielii (strain ATCC 17100 / DSM 162 / LMG 4299 / NCIMB 10020 / ATH 3.1.1) TaxID=648757 RepID=E3I7A5_RHOVT|nr:hypothetical protein Rvan_1504 [Rhodomicrobium vannielii ATCC 17100]
MGLFGTIIGLFLMLTGLPFLAAGLGSENMLSDLQGMKLYETAFGAALMIAGFVIGKFWSLKVKPKRTVIE